MSQTAALPSVLVRKFGRNLSLGNAQEPHPDSISPEEIANPPEFLSGERARQVWDYVVPRLAKYGLATEVDVLPLIRLCNSWGIAIDAQIEVTKHVEAKHWENLVASKGGQYRPVMQLRNKMVEELRDLESQFGMTPSARTKIAINKQLGLPGFEDYPEGMNPAVARLEAFREKLGLAA